MKRSSLERSNLDHICYGSHIRPIAIESFFGVNIEIDLEAIAIDLNTLSVNRVYGSSSLETD